ncbi:MAG: ATP-binding protein, partial [Methanobacteriaceae archaeon]|nr:ATP-binding protein [Methanobacteriaceae archaeon]
MIKRELYLKKIRKLIDKEEIKVITGVRRSGKTCLLKLIKEELIERGVNEKNIFYITFESAKYDFIKDYTDLNDYIFKIIPNESNIEFNNEYNDESKFESNEKVYLLFDEIQLVENWEKSINAFRVDLNADIYITGSNSNLLTGDLATLLAGRYISIPIFPFSFKEIIEYYDSKNIEITEMKKIQLFQEYLDYGGFPGLLKYDSFEKLDYLRDIYDSIVLNDVLSRNNIKNMDLLKKLIQYVINTIGQPFSSTSISKYLKNEGVKSSPKTILNYMQCISNSFLIYNAKREDLKGKTILKSYEKYYLVDIGFYYLFNDKNNRSMGSLLE